MSVQRAPRHFAFLLVSALVFAGATAQAQSRFYRPTQSTRGSTRTSNTSDVAPFGDAHIEYDSQTRSLIVTTDEKTNEHIKTLIERLDHAVPQA